MVLSSPKPCAGCKQKEKKRRKIKCTVGEFVSKTRCPWKTKHQYLSSAVTRDRCIQCCKKKQKTSTLLLESLIWRLTGNLHFMEIWWTCLSTLGRLPQISDASKPRGCCTSSLTAELEAAHQQYFYPWKLTASALHFHSAKFCYAVFLPLSRGL